MLLLILGSIGIIFCIICSNFFSGSEMSYSSCNRTRLENMAEDGDKRARMASNIVDHFDDTLSTILIGNNLVNIACSSLGTVLVIEIFKHIHPEASENDAPTWISTVVLTILIIIFGETIPKIVCKKQANKKALKNAGLIRFLNIILKPFVVPVVALVHLITSLLKGENNDSSSEDACDELTDIIETAEEENVLEEDTSELVQAAIDFNDVPVYEVMTARVDMVAINIEDDYEEIRNLIENSTYTRIPVYEGSIDNMIGTLSLNRYLRACLTEKAPDIRSMMMPPKYVYKTTKLPNVLSELRKAKQHLAIVTDEYGGTLGVVSMEDVLEEIVGDIWDESDEIEKEVVETSDGRYEFDGDTSISSFLDELDLSEGSLECVSDTVGGFAIETLQHFPKSGEYFLWHGYKLTVLEADELRVSKVLCEKLPEEDDTKEN